MDDIYSYYKENIESYTRLTDRLRRKIHLLGTIRLTWVIIIFICIWLFREESALVLTGISVLFVLLFAALMVYHNKLSIQRTYAESMISLNENELKGLDYDFDAFDGAPENTSSDHSFGLDLDIFGKRSIFQSVNRTITFMGKELLADWFQNPLHEKTQILKRQEAVKELSSRSRLRQHFFVTGIQQSGDKKDRQTLLSLNSDTFYFLNRLWSILVWLVPAIWILLIIGSAYQLINPALLVVYLCLSFLIANLPAKRITLLYNKTDKMEKIFSVYSSLMRCIEEEEFDGEELKEISAQLTGKEKVPASRAIRQLSGYLSGLNQRFSIGGILFNLFYLRDIRHAIYLERWKRKYQDKIVLWFDALGHFDALSSLSGFAFNHPDAVYPDIADTYFQMEGKALYHPLLHRDTCVKNDIDIRKSPWFLIITGANMAGKSTYLRTVGVNYIFACMGMPVCAASLTVYPASLVTSLRTSDSLVSNESYFFAELKRLKMIIDRLKNGEELFIILDEILKGTNSIDKQKGSMALMKQLVTFQTCGIIATHDLLLGTLEEEFPSAVRNYRFEADIKNNELSFSYQLREGIAQNMNASFLMERMGITF